MIIYPAIDLIAGEVVRLHKGDFEQKTTYGTDPVSVARAYAEAGAAWLHLVDLDGAKDPANRQTGLIADIIAGSGLKVQTGGGIRSRADVEALLAAGASRRSTSTGGLSMAMSSAPNKQRQKSRLGRRTRAATGASCRMKMRKTTTTKTKASRLLEVKNSPRGPCSRLDARRCLLPTRRRRRASRRPWMVLPRLFPGCSRLDWKRRSRLICGSARVLKRRSSPCTRCWMKAKHLQS